VGENIIGGNKKLNVRVNIRPKKAAEPFNNDQLLQLPKNLKN
jgi:hypothetical protein